MVGGTGGGFACVRERSGMNRPRAVDGGAGDELPGGLFGVRGA